MKPGEILDGRYKIIDRLGAGGMGEVYKATHTLLGSSRVIKVVHPHISASEDARERFLREARAATKVQHQNVATLHDFAVLPDGAHYMVWECIEGENLAQRLRAKGTLPSRQVVRIAIEVLRGLEAIHRAGIIHRDVSPENLMITDSDEVKIIDLGVAKLEDADAVSQTRTGIFVGKLRYASPEQLGFLPEGEKVDARADIYALAMVLVELLTGRPPYEAKSPHEYFLLHAREPLMQPVQLPAGMPGGEPLKAAIEKALARDRNMRYATARDFASALEEIERMLPDPRDTPTVATPLDADATMRQSPPPPEPDTLHRETVRTNAPAEATVRTNAPVIPTERTDVPTSPPPKMRKGINPAILVAFIAVVILGIAGVVLWPRLSESEPVVAPQTASTASTTSAALAPPRPSETSVVVTSQTATVPTVTSDTAPALLSQPIVTETTATAPPVQPKPAPPVAVEPRRPARTVQPPPSRVVETAPETEESEDVAPTRTSLAGTYVDGGDDDNNDRMLDRLRAEVRGSKQVAVRAGSMTVELTRALRDHLPDIEFVGDAAVVIRFDGTIERLGRGRKRRSATGTVSKNGQVIFRYELPNEVYRVGMSPPDAFARVVADALAP